METLEQQNAPKKGISKTFIAALLIGIALIAGAVYLISLKPSTFEEKQLSIEGAFREGSPEFEALTKRIAIQTDENNTTESPIGLGTIVMFISGDIKNLSDKTLTGLEINVGVLDFYGNIIKEKTLVVIPEQVERLEPKKIMDVTVRIDGFEKAQDRASIRWKVTAIRAE